MTPSLSSDFDVGETTFSMTPFLKVILLLWRLVVLLPRHQASLMVRTLLSLVSCHQQALLMALSPYCPSAILLLSSSSASDTDYDSTTTTTTTTDVTSSPSSTYDSTTTTTTNIAPSPSSYTYDNTNTASITPSPSSSVHDSTTTTTTATDIAPTPSGSVYDSTTTTTTTTDITPSQSSSAYDSTTTTTTTTTTDITPSPSSSTYDSTTTTTTDIIPSQSSSAYDSTTTTTATTDITPSPSSSTYDSTTTTTTDIAPTPTSSVYDSTTPAATTPSSSMTADMTTSGPATPSSSSQSTVTSAVTSTSPSTSPPSYQYPTQAPDLEGALFIFTFSIEGNPANFSLIWITNLKEKIGDIFRKNVVGFDEVRIQGNLYERKRRHARSSEGINIEAKFKAKDLYKVDKNVLQENLKTAMQNSENIFKNYSYNLDINQEQIASFAALTSDVCNSQKTKGLCGVEYTCSGGVCQHLCEDTYCGGHGQCYVHVFDNKVSTKCQCTSQNPFNYEGVACERAVMKEQYVAAIAVSVFGVLLLVLVVVVVCLCRQVNRKSVRSPRDELIPLDQTESWSYKSLPTKHNPVYSNHGYEPHYMAYREIDPAVYDFRALPRDRSRDSYDVRLREADLSSFPHLSSERKFSIKRPQVSSEPANSE
ncbi:A-agglutinin anchorage subunit-like isoform X1 [Pomacea canaliculata]|uniref:A-agglutinin anchorage subunit-like isoform X1 n=1 Tax=Pomacea canaliculata TaxID=400727 RepID=UPI000D72A819|nr:A-agglutinin anchorage subunit-like isoform X1 [Pomacea canaliculata]